MSSDPKITPEERTRIIQEYGLLPPGPPKTPVPVPPPLPPLEALRPSPLNVTPHVGIGPLKLGMTMSEMENAARRLCQELYDRPDADRFLQLSQDAFGSCVTIRYNCGALFFLADFLEEKAVSVGVDRWTGELVPILLDGTNVFSTPAEPLLELLKEKDSLRFDGQDEQLACDCLFPALGIRLWREQAFHPKLLLDPLWVEEMQAVLEDEKENLYFQIIRVCEPNSCEL